MKNNSSLLRWRNKEELFSGTHHSCERREYAFMVFWEYLINFLYIYIKSQNLEKIQLDFNWIFNFAPYVLFNF